MPVSTDLTSGVSISATQNLSEATLRGTNLSEANLSEANLAHADMTDADLRRANVTSATFRLTNLKGAKLDGVDLQSANFEDAVFSVEQFRIYTEDNSVADADELFRCAKKIYEALGYSVGDKSEWIKGSLLQNSVAWLRGLRSSEKTVGSSECR